MKRLIVVTLLSSLFSLSANADSSLDKYINKPYAEARPELLKEGWQPMTNKQIQDTSMYAQGVYENGYEEVLDCISMERDQCQFVLVKNTQHIVITTKEKSFNIESIETVK